jgi:serine/threonine protein kinase
MGLGLYMTTDSWTGAEPRTPPSAAVRAAYPLKFSRSSCCGGRPAQASESEDCAIFISESAHPTLVVETASDVVEIPLENKRALAWEGVAGGHAFALHTWQTGTTVYIFSCPSKELVQYWLAELQAVGCIMQDLKEKCTTSSTTPIGSGTSSRIVRATMNVAGEPAQDVVLKIAKPGNDAQFINEVQKVRFLLKSNERLEAHVVAIRGLYELLANGRPALGAVLDRVAGGDLGAHVPPGGMTETVARGVFRQLFTAVAGLEEVGMVHLDVKPENILCDAAPDGSLRARLTDFGLATLLAEEHPDGRESGRGTPGFIAPELLRGAPRATQKSDCFSLGATLFFAATGSAPFRAQSIRDLLVRNAQGFRADASGLSVELADLLTRLGTADPAERLSAAAALAHPWFTEHAS